MTAADILRIFVMVLGGAVIFSTVLIVVTYARCHRNRPYEGPRFLPHHIATIAAAFIILALFGMVESGQRLGDPLTWQGPTLLTAFSLANIAQAIMLSIVRAQGQERQEP